MDLILLRKRCVLIQCPSKWHISDKEMSPIGPVSNRLCVCKRDDPSPFHSSLFLGFPLNYQLVLTDERRTGSCDMTSRTISFFPFFRPSSRRIFQRYFCQKCRLLYRSPINKLFSCDTVASRIHSIYKYSFDIASNFFFFGSSVIQYI